MASDDGVAAFSRKEVWEQMLKAEKIKSGIYMVSADSHAELSATFVRFQEHYESPEFRGKIFSLDEYKTWYEDRYGGWTYEEDWSGFNFPGHILRPFRDGLFDPLTDGERELMALFDSLEGDFYVIGTNDPAAVEHEICHGLYHTDPGYKREMDILVSNLPADQKGRLERFLIKAGYHEAVFVDEMQALIAANADELNKNKEHFPKEIVWPFREVYEKFFFKIKEWL
jgi:hypothetical protein